MVKSKTEMAAAKSKMDVIKAKSKMEMLYAKSKMEMANPKSKMMFDSYSDSDTAESEKPSPANFCVYLPWACNYLSLDIYVEVSRGIQANFSQMEGVRRKGLAFRLDKKNAASESARSIGSFKNIFSKSLAENENKVVRITANYSGDKLVQIKFDKTTKNLPREILSIISLIIQFYPYLTSFYINSGANKYTIHEMCKILPSSNITEINLDDTSIRDGNYDAILDYSKKLQILSLSRCSLYDHVVERIASKLEVPQPCSKTLKVLNLSSNRITENGAKCLGKMLRTNRSLVYLNLADNTISDDGIEIILNTLHKFPLTDEERFIVRNNYINFMRKRQILIEGYLKILERTEQPKPKLPRKPSLSSITKSSIDRSRHNLVPPPSNVMYEKALKLAISECGEYNDPLGKDIISIDDRLYSSGNYNLAYLNIAYNNISQLSVKLLLKVLRYQNAEGNKTPKGLVNIRLEGNPIPESTPELLEIDYILQKAVASAKQINLRRKSIIKSAANH